MIECLAPSFLLVEIYIVDFSMYKKILFQEVNYANVLIYLQVIYSLLKIARIVWIS